MPHWHTIDCIGIIAGLSISLLGGKRLLVHSRPYRWQHQGKVEQFCYCILCFWLKLSRHSPICSYCSCCFMMKWFQHVYYFCGNIVSFLQCSAQDLPIHWVLHLLQLNTALSIFLRDVSECHMLQNIHMNHWTMGGPHYMFQHFCYDLISFSWLMAYSIFSILDSCAVFNSSSSLPKSMPLTQSSLWQGPLHAEKLVTSWKGLSG